MQICGRKKFNRMTGEGEMRGEFMSEHDLRDLLMDWMDRLFIFTTNLD